MSAFDNYGEDIGGQSYSSYSDTPGDSGGGGDGPRSITDPTKGFDIAPPPAERLSFLDRVKSFGGDIFKGITSLALGLSPQNLIASQFLPTVIGSLKDRLFPNYKTGINTIELDDRFTMPMNKPNIPFLTEGGITDLRYSPEILGQMANKPDYKVGDISDKTFNAAIGSGYNPYTGEELQPGEAQELQDQRNQSNLGLGTFVV